MHQREVLVTIFNGLVMSINVLKLKATITVPWPHKSNVEREIGNVRDQYGEKVEWWNKL